MAGRPLRRARLANPSSFRAAGRRSTLHARANAEAVVGNRLGLQLVQDVYKWMSGLPATAVLRPYLVRMKLTGSKVDRGFWAGEVLGAVLRDVDHSPLVVEYAGHLFGQHVVGNPRPNPRKPKAVRAVPGIGAWKVIAKIAGRPMTYKWWRYHLRNAPEAGEYVAGRPMHEQPRGWVVSWFPDARASSGLRSRLGWAKDLGEAIAIVRWHLETTGGEYDRPRTR